MKARAAAVRSLVVVLLSVLLPLLRAQTAPPPPSERRVATAETIELSPFIVETQSSQGYYASQTLAGGRLRQDLKDLGTSIQVVTKEFMDDLAITGIEELFQYTTGTEVGGIMGNFTGASDGGAGETSTGDARRDPDGTSRVRGLAAPDRARNFFKTDIPFDAYNTDRIDINRGANSFLFGLGSPSGLINTGLARARFRNSNEISTRLDSGGRSPSVRGSFALNRVLLKDRVALHVAALADHTKYRQEPTFKNDERIYGAATIRPFRHRDTVIYAHVERGLIRGRAPDTLLPQQNLVTFLADPANARLSVNAHGNLVRFGHVEGPTQAQWNALSAADKLRFRVRNTPDANSLINASWANGAYGLVYDGTNGRLPAFAYTDQYRAVDYATGDPFFNPTRLAKTAPYNVYHGNVSAIRGTGWRDQGFTNLRTFDFSRALLAWDNDYYTRDFANWQASLEQVLWDGRAGFEFAADYQELRRSDFVAFNGPVSTVHFDINETIWLPQDPNYPVSGNAAPRANPNYGRPFVLSKANRRTNASEREAFRFTGFVKHDFATTFRGRPRLGRLLGRHTLTLLADRSVFDEKVVNYNLNSFGDPEPALHIGPANARQTGNDVRGVPMMAYIGPPQPRAFTDPNFTLADFRLAPANYQLWPADGFRIQKLSWNLGPDATNETFGLDSRANGNERFVTGTLEPRSVPNKNYRLQRTRVSSLALNAQSHVVGDLLVLNLGYRRDRVTTLLNTEAPLVGLDELADISEAAFRVENGTRVRTEAEIFGYGAVLHWPHRLLRLPKAVNLLFHYNDTENFIPATDRVDQYRRPVASPAGASRDWGVSVFLWDSKVVARFNWYRATLARASSNVSDLFNQTNTNIFNHYGNLNRDVLRLDADGDGRFDAAYLATIAVDPATGLTPAGRTREQEAAFLNPNLAAVKEARAAIAPHLTDALKVAYNYRVAADGTSLTQFAGPITDTNDILSRGFEAELVFNPTRNWRIAFNAAKQETILTNIAPALTALLENTWLPHLAKYGRLDWNAPAEVLNGNTTTQQINDRLLDYYAAKGQEGRPQSEQRKWRANAVARYQFSEGRLRGFSLGGAVRWEDVYATGYPVLDDPRGFILPDVAHPYWSDPTLSVDVNFGYRRRIAGNRDWSVQLNVRNLQNWHSDTVSTIRTQPDGSSARVRFDPPLQLLLTNTVRF